MVVPKPKVQIKLKKHEHILAVVPVYCSGPGWANAVLRIHIADEMTHMYRTEFIQPNERNAVQHTLFRAGEELAQSLIASVVVKKEK